MYCSAPLCVPQAYGDTGLYTGSASNSGVELTTNGDMSVGAWLVVLALAVMSPGQGQGLALGVLVPQTEPGSG